MSAMPLMTVSVMAPMPGAVSPSGMWWFFPAAACPYIGAVFFPPVFIYPHMPRARCCYAH